MAQSYAVVGLVKSGPDTIWLDIESTVGVTFKWQATHWFSWPDAP